VRTLIGLIALTAAGLGAWRAIVQDETRRQVWILQHDPDADRRAGAVAALYLRPSGLSCEAAYSIFLRALDDPSPRVREAVRFALNRFGPGSGIHVPVLARVVCDGYYDARSTAIVELDRIARSGRDREVMIPALLGLLKDADPIDRCNAAKMLSLLGRGADVVAPMIAILEGKDCDPTSEGGLSTLRQCASEALGRAGPPARKAIPMLRATLRDPSGRTRIAAARALAALGETDVAWKALREALDDPDPTNRRVAADSLEAIAADHLNF
jgi:HEAT repeat protein